MFIKSDIKTHPLSEVNTTRTTSTSDQDRRYLPRWEVDNKIIFQKGNDPIPHECRSKDIAATGACIRAMEDISPSQILNLTIYLANDIEPIQVHGKAVWRQKKDNEHLIGIQFNSISDTTSDRIYHYAFEYRKTDLMKNWFKGF